MNIKTTANNMVFVPLEKTIDNRDQSGAIDKQIVAEIKASLKLHRDNGTKGLLEIPPARITSDGLYEMTFGRHRRAAFLELATEDPFWNEIPLIVREMDDLQMLEALGVEKISHRDVSPLEIAEFFQTYMTRTGKNSVETAAVFGKTDEYVRSVIRLTNLVEPAKELMRAGKVNTTVARDVLTAQRIVSPERLKTALADIEHGTFDNNPQRAIFNAIVTEALCINGAWVDAKKFPMKYLAPVQRKDVAQLLDVQAGDKARKLLLDQLMEFVKAGMDIPDHRFSEFSAAQLEKVHILIAPPACAACPLHAQYDGRIYCGLKPCAERKAQAWKQFKVAELSKALDIPLYVNEETDGKCVDLNRYVGADMKLFTDRHKDLRLRPTNRTIYNNFPGLPNDVLLVVVGKTAEKRLAEQQKKANEPASRENYKEQERATEQARIQMALRELKEKFVAGFTYHVIAPAFACLLEVSNLPFGIFLYTEVIVNALSADFPPDVDHEESFAAIADMVDTKKKAVGLKQLQQLMIFQVVDWRLSDSFERVAKAKKPIIELAEVAQKLAEEWSVKLPKDFMQQAKKYQADFDTAVKEIHQPEKA